MFGLNSLIGVRSDIYAAFVCNNISKIYFSNIRSRVEHPGPVEHFPINPVEANKNTTPEEFSQTRSMSYYEVSRDRSTISTRPTALPLVPPSQDFPSSQTDRSPTTMQSRLI